MSLRIIALTPVSITHLRPIPRHRTRPTRPSRRETTSPPAVIKLQSVLVLMPHLQGQHRPLTRLTIDAIKYLLEGFQDGYAIRKDPVSQEERVQEVNGQKTKIWKKYQENTRKRESRITVVDPRDGLFRTYQLVSGVSVLV